jgi:hypothetical protein
MLSGNCLHISQLCLPCYEHMLTISALKIHKAFTPPNPTPAKPWGKDSLGPLVGNLQRQFYLILFLPPWFCHILFIIFPESKSTPSICCPHPAQLDAKYFTWNLYTASCMLLVLIAAPIRLLAYKQLGRNFTFALAKPKEVIKTGLYAYV